jgi:NO-binding membrane sensor protein with MHYT domain
MAVTYGTLQPLLAYLVSCIGVGFGLTCMLRARNVTEPLTRYGWLAFAAISIGGTGIWGMHFIAMLGYSVSDLTIRYNITLTLISMAVAIVVVFFGLLVVLLSDGQRTGLLLGGTITGVGVAAMHYMGMAAMNVQATISYNDVLVLASFVIAIAASTVALWASLNLHSKAIIGLASLVMGIAVAGMHYTGMAAMRMTMNMAAPSPSGTPTSTFVTPIIAIFSLFTVMALFIVVLSPSEAELLEEARLTAQLEQIRTAHEH